MFLLYTGGTTGLPKGVMWRQGDLFCAVDAPSRHRLGERQDLDALGRRLRTPSPRNLPCAPLMHGTGLFNALSNLIVGGSVTTLKMRTFDAGEVLSTIQDRSINSISIAGDAFARPLLTALDAEPKRWDISTLRVVVSSGVMWSNDAKQRLLGHNPRLILVDTLGSSEAIGGATNVTRSDAATGKRTAEFRLGPGTRVITDEGRDVIPGSGETGRIAIRGYTPLGYYKDADKSAETFVLIDGHRYSVPGDLAEILSDGSLRLIGRGSQCINTGGEKVYPEEVEECLKEHDAVVDAAVVGVPDERFGEAVTAIVELRPDAVFEAQSLIDHVKSRLARYKAPKYVDCVHQLGRASNGKLDYTALRRDAADRHQAY